MFAQQVHDARVARLAADVRVHPGALRLPDQAGRAVVHVSFEAGADGGGFVALQHVQSHGAACRFVQDQSQKIEAHHAMERRGEVVKQLRQAAVQGDGFRNLQERAVAARQRLFAYFGQAIPS